MADQRYEPDPDEEDGPRSIFAAMWFRALVVVLVLGVIAAIAVPYALDLVSPPVPIPVAMEPPKPAPPTPPPTPATPTPGTVAAPPTTPAPAVAPPAPAPGPPKPVPAPPRVAKAPAETPAPLKPAPPTTARAPRPRPARSAPGVWWVQVGAFKDPAAARRLATLLKEQNYNVEQSVHRVKREGTAPAPAASTDKYDVFVAGAAPAELAAQITAKGLAAETVADGVVVKPSLPLREAVQLSKDLAAGGLKVHVRRAGGGEAAPGPAPAPIEEAFHRVRVGSYADRAAALAVVRGLQERGHKPFLVRESP